MRRPSWKFPIYRTPSVSVSALLHAEPDEIARLSRARTAEIQHQEAYYKILVNPVMLQWDPTDALHFIRDESIRNLRKQLGLGQNVALIETHWSISPRLAEDTFMVSIVVYYDVFIVHT